MVVKIDNALIGACIARAGWRKGPRLAQFIGEWALAEHAEGKQLGPEDFVAWWREGSRMTAYRRLGEFRQAFPELGPEATPTLIATAVERQGRYVGTLRPGVVIT